MRWLVRVVVFGIGFVLLLGVIAAAVSTYLALWAAWWLLPLLRG